MYKTKCNTIDHNMQIPSKKRFDFINNREFANYKDKRRHKHKRKTPFNTSRHAVLILNSIFKFGLTLPYNSPETWLCNGDYHPGNVSKHIQETHRATKRLHTISASKFEWKTLVCEVILAITLLLLFFMHPFTHNNM